MDVPASVKALRAEILAQQGGSRRDDVEFTFVKGRWNHLGEATLMNRVKSHTDVAERWYPDLLAEVRAQQAREKAQASARSNTAIEAH
jgi:hypothetical protein